MALFLSSYENKLDKKGRVSVPAQFRAALGEGVSLGVVVFRSSQHACLEGFSYRSMEGLAERLDAFDMFSSEHEDLATAIFGESVQLSIDGEGRVILSDELRDFIGADERVVFVGLGNKFQIWSPDEFAARKGRARQSVQEKGLTLPKVGNEKEGGV